MQALLVEHVLAFQSLCKEKIWIGASTECSAHLGIEKAQTDLVGCVHPTKPFPWNVFKVDTNVAIFNLNLVC